jgi:hypothetical protein
VVETPMREMVAQGGIEFKEMGRGGHLGDPFARRARTIRMCSLNARR